jgi:activating signal cointegrator complex subunit 3
MGQIASFYYLTYQTMKHFGDSLSYTASFEELMRILCDAYEFAEQPVRHNEEKYNE